MKSKETVPGDVLGLGALERHPRPVDDAGRPAVVQVQLAVGLEALAAQRALQHSPVAAAEPEVLLQRVPRLAHRLASRLRGRRPRLGRLGRQLAHPDGHRARLQHDSVLGIETGSPNIESRSFTTALARSATSHTL